MELCLNSRMTNFSPSFRQMRRLGSGKFSDAEVMGKKLHCFKQTGQQSKKQLTVKMSIFTSDVGTEVKLRDLEMEKRDPRTVVAVILGGGAGTGLFPLTQRRAIPAVPMGGAYRLIDVPMSNCINSGINKVYILTQFNSASLNRHLARAYNFSNGVSFVDGFVDGFVVKRKNPMRKQYNASRFL